VGLLADQEPALATHGREVTEVPQDKTGKQEAVHWNARKTGGRVCVMGLPCTMGQEVACCALEARTKALEQEKRLFLPQCPSSTLC
jgi:hypothetical protein